MEAAVFVEKNRIEIDEKSIPDVGPQDALVKITTTTICGTDVHILKGEYPVEKGLAIGHEPVGTAYARARFRSRQPIPHSRLATACMSHPGTARTAGTSLWSKQYSVSGMSMEEAAADVADRLGIELQRRYSSYGGPYYQWRNRPDELFVRNNVVDGGDLTGGDLTYPDLPEGVLVVMATEQADTFKTELERSPAYELFELREFGDPHGVVEGI